MASTRSTTRQRRAQRPEPPETPRSALIALARRGARIQIAACAAAATTLARWAEAADHYAQTVGDEVLRRVDGETDSPELMRRLTAATGSHLRDLSTLPRTATDHFDARLVRVPIDN